MTDLFVQFNKTNLKLQGDQLNLIKLKVYLHCKTFSTQTKLGDRRMFSDSKSF